MGWLKDLFKIFKRPKEWIEIKLPKLKISKEEGTEEEKEEEEE